MFEILIQGIGFLGIAASIISFQCKNHKGIIAFRTLNEFLFAIQYFLLGAYTGMAMNIIGCIRNIIFAEMVKAKKKTTVMCFIFSVVFLLFTALTWSGLKSILIGFAKVVSTFAYGNKNTTVIRWLILLTCCCWLIYNISVNSLAGALCEAFTICSIIVGIIRIDILHKNKKERG